MKRWFVEAVRSAMHRRSRLGWVGFAVGVALLLALAVEQVLRVGDFRVDDAYITFSFSKNLAAGHGPVFSHGVRVEGYSNFLWMVLVSLVYLVAPAADPYWGVRALSLLFLLGALIAVYRLVRAHASTWAAFVALALLLVNSDVMRAALSGLETVPFLACIVLGWSAYFAPPGRYALRGTGWFLAAALMRIDGFVPLLIVLGFELASALSERRFTWRRYLTWSLPPVGAWLGYFAWRFWYYGLPLPTTYYAKTVVSQNQPDRGYDQLWGFCRDYGVLALLPLACIPLFRGPRKQAWGVGLAAALQLGYAAQTGGDWMPFERFLLPAFPLLVVLVGWGLSRFARELRALHWLPRVAAGLTLAASLAFTGVHVHAASTDSPEEAEKLGNAKHVAQHTRENLLKNADLMHAVLRRPGERLVTDYAGVFSVYTEAAIIDQWGLCNAEIALKGGTQGINPIYGKSCAECYATLDPDYFHVVVPIVRDRDAFTNQQQVIQNVFQGPDIDRVIQLRKNFVTGRVEQANTGRVLWFLEKRRPGLSYEPRSAGSGLRVDYPFL